MRYDAVHVEMSGLSSHTCHTSMVVALPKKGRERRSRTTVHPRKRGEKGSNQIISREFDGVKPNPRSFSSDPISASDQDGIAIFLWGTELGICWTSRVKSHTSIQCTVCRFVTASEA